MTKLPVRYLRLGLALEGDYAHSEGSDTVVRFVGDFGRKKHAELCAAGINGIVTQYLSGRRPRGWAVTRLAPLSEIEDDERAANATFEKMMSGELF